MSNTQSSFFFRCPNCKTKNRIPAGKVGNIGKCGKCGSPLETNQLKLPQPVTISDGNFDTMVLKAPVPVIVDCWAAWCGACKILSPVIDNLAQELKGRVRIGKLNVEQNPLLSSRFDMRSIPVILIFDGGVLKDTIVGAAPKEMILQKLTPYL